MWLHFSIVFRGCQARFFDASALVWDATSGVLVGRKSKRGMTTADQMSRILEAQKQSAYWDSYAEYWWFSAWLVCSRCSIGKWLKCASRWDSVCFAKWESQSRCPLHNWSLHVTSPWDLTEAQTACLSATDVCTESVIVVLWSWFLPPQNLLTQIHLPTETHTLLHLPVLTCHW